MFAHSGKDPSGSDWEPLIRHLTEVGDKAAMFAEPFGVAAMARAAGVLHDIGKASPAFQRYIAGEGPSPDHSTAGALEAQKRYGDPLGRIIAFAIAGHHAGLADGPSLTERLRDSTLLGAENLQTGERHPYGLDIPEGRELAPEPRALYAALKRVEVEVLPGETDDPIVAARFGQAPQMLCILNSRAHARELFDAIAGLEGAVHLSTLMCPVHRRCVLDTVRAALKGGRPARVVSTSLIEAGVDISFPEVWRASTGLDSIAHGGVDRNINSDGSVAVSGTSPSHGGVDRNGGSTMGSPLSSSRPLTGAWIETARRRRRSPASRVALSRGRGSKYQGLTHGAHPDGRPLTGAWIET